MECRSDGCESGCRRVRGGPVEKGACRQRGREGGERGHWARPPGSEPEADTQPCSQHSAQGCMPPASREQSRRCQEPRGLQRLVARPGFTDFNPLRRAGEPRGLELGWAWRELGKGSPGPGEAWHRQVPAPECHLHVCLTLIGSPALGVRWAGLGAGLNPHPQRLQVSDIPLGILLFLPEKSAAHLEARLRPLDAGSGVSGGGEEPSRVPRAQVGQGHRGWQEWVQEPKRVVSSPRSESAWQQIPLPLPLGHKRKTGREEGEEINPENAKSYIPGRSQC